MKVVERERACRVVILGAGIAGLTVGYDLQKAGFDVTLLESEEIPGGRMGTRTEGTFLKYTGATGLFEFYRDMWDLIGELGLKDRLSAYPKMGKGIVVKRDGSYELDFNQRAGMLLHAGMSLRSRLRLPSLLPDFLRAYRSVDPCFIHTAAEFDDESMAEYLTRKVGRDFLENVVGPVYRNLWAWNVEEASKAYFLAIYPHVRNRPSYTFRNGISELCVALASGLDVRYGATVRSVEHGDDCEGRTVVYDTAQGPARLAADIVVCALPGDKVAPIVRDKTSWEAAFFRDVPYADYGMVHYVLKQPPRIEYSPSHFFLRESRNPISMIKTFPGDPTGLGNPPRIWTVFSADRARHYYDRDGDGLERVMRHHLKKLYPTLDDEIAEIHVMRKNYTIAAFPPGRARSIRSFLSTQESGPKNIYYVGDYLSNATTGGACAIGRRTAALICAHWR